MVKEFHPDTQNKCEFCGEVIPKVRLMSVRNERTCVKCQKKLEKNPWELEDPNHREVQKQQDDADLPNSLELQDDHVKVGGWSNSLLEMTSRGVELRTLMDSGKVRDARTFVQHLTVPAQAALVSLDQNPEEVLSVTGMTDSELPAYCPQVVDLLPTELLADLVAPHTEYLRFNIEVLKAMSPKTFRRVMLETLDPIDNLEYRAQVSWEWLEALVAIDDPNKIAELVGDVEVELLEDAIITRFEYLDMHQIVGGDVPLFRTFSESGNLNVNPGDFFKEPKTAEVIKGLHEAVPDLLNTVIRGAWERAGED